MMRISQKIYAKYQVQIPLNVFLENPTIEGLSLFLSNETVVDVSRNVNFFSENDRASFSDKKPNIRNAEHNSVIELEDIKDSALEENLHLHSSHRDFDQSPIEYDTFVKFISVLRGQAINNKNKYQYPSAGSTYAVQTYIHFKEDAVVGISAGIYYYNPIQHSLMLITKDPSISTNIHFYYNRPIYKKAKFSIYFIAQMRAIEPIYGDESMHFVTLEAGSILQLLLRRQSDYGIGLCPIGTINFNEIRDHFKLEHSHHLIATVVGGRVKENKVQPKRVAQQVSAKDIAIIGVSGTYPGASDLEEFWLNLKGGKNSIIEVPGERWDYRKYHNPGEGQYGKWGGFINNVDKFEPELFEIDPKEANKIDPQQRLLLMNVWKTLENAGYTSSTLNETSRRVGVFVGVMWDDYHDLATFSSFRHSLANRVSFVFDFKGPSIVLDTSCASGLTALHMACESIKSGVCESAIAGGVNLILHPNHLLYLSQSNLMSSSNKSCAFSAEGTGWIPGEGVGCVLLKPLDRAVADGDYIHGVIKSSFINHSGRTRRYTMPAPQVQAELISETYKRGNIDPESINYIECASNGSLLFDSSEISGLTLAFQSLGAKKMNFCRIGSVKPNIGHLESASAFSQLSKVLLQMKHQQLVESIYSQPINPLIQLNNTPFKIQQNLETWERDPTGLPFRAGISAFGGAGSYGHLVVEEYQA